MPEDKTFWTTDMEALRQRQDYLTKLYTGMHEIVLHTADGGWNYPIYHCFNLLGDRLSKTMATLVWRRFPYLKTKSKGQQDTLKRIVNDTQLMLRVHPTQVAVSALGNSTLKLLWARRAGDKGKPYIRRWGSKPGEFVWWEYEGDYPYAVSFYYDEVMAEFKGQKNVTVRVRERFEMVMGRDEVLVTNLAYPFENGKLDTSSPINLADLYPENTPKDEAKLAMTFLPAFQVCNVGEGHGQTDYTPSMISLQKSQARLSSQRDLAIAINEMPVMNVPVSALNPDGTLDLSKLWVTMRENGESGEEHIPINFNNWTGNLSESEKQWHLNEEEFYAMSGLSPAIDGKAIGAGAESGYARVLGLTKTIAAVEQRRMTYNDFWTWYGISVPEFAAAQGNREYGKPIEDVSAEWVPAVPEDMDAVSQRIDRGKKGGWITLETAIAMEHPDWSPDQVQEEADKVRKEMNERAATAVPNFTLPSLGSGLLPKPTQASDGSQSDNGDGNPSPEPGGAPAKEPAVA